MVEPSGARTLASVDLGSNSFHMIVARFDRGLPVVMDRIREHVQLASGLGADKRLNEETVERALSCLKRFGERLREVSASNVRAVGTNTLRKAKNGRDFVNRASQALGKDIEVISGREEARLIYLGVAHAVDQDSDVGRRLVVDIGGGSTELIVGERFEPMRRDSLQVGCVRYRTRFFEDGRITEKRMRKAAVAARLELRSLERHYRDMGWEVALGASGTIKAIDRVLRANEWSERGITLEGLERLREELLSAGHVERLKLAGLSEERAPVLPSGLAILLGIFDSLELRSMTASTGALREGVLYDLIGRIRREDVRERTIASFQQRYAVDRPFAARVERTARELFSQVAEAWQLDEPAGRRFLSWAARLHEIGLSLSHSGHHRHAAYIVRNSDMPGFSRDDQEMLAAIVLGHRRRVTRDRLGTLVAPGRVETALRLCICLRIARRLNRVRTRRAILTVRMEASENGVRVVFPRGWLEEHPLTWADLEDEAWVLRTTGYEMEVVSEGELSSS